MTDRVDEIIKAVAAEYRIAPRQIFTPTHKKEIARPRQVAMALTRHITRQSWSWIAHRFAKAGDRGRMHHTTVMFAAKRVADRRASDPEFAAKYGRCLARALQTCTLSPQPIRCGRAPRDLENDALERAIAAAEAAAAEASRRLQDLRARREQAQEMAA